MVLRHDFETDITVGYLLSQQYSKIHHGLLGIPQQFRTLAHPLLVPFLIGEQILEQASIEQDSVDDDLIDIEMATGFNDYSLNEHDGGPQDYRKLSKGLGAAASKYAQLKSRLSAFKAMYEFLSRELKSYQSWIPKDKWQIYMKSTRALVKRAEYTASHIEHLLMYRGLEMRLQVQQNVVSTDSLAVNFEQY